MGRRSLVIFVTLSVLAVAAVAVPDAAPPAHLGTSAGLPDDFVPRLPTDRVTLDASAMPGEVGWFLVPVSVDAPGWVEVRAEMTLVTDRAPGAAGLLLLMPGGAFPHPGTRGTPAGSAAQTSVAGEGAACCPSPSPSTFQDLRTASARVAAGDVLWVGLAAVGWAPGSAALFTVEATPGELHTPVHLAAGAPVTGAHVAVHDLVAEAYEAGTAARAGGYEVAGGAAPVTLRFDAEGPLVLAIDHAAVGDASVLVEVVLPDGGRLDNAPGRGVQGSLSALAPPGPLELRVSAVRGPHLATLADLDREPSGVLARALLVDLEGVVFSAFDP